MKSRFKLKIYKYEALYSEELSNIARFKPN